MTEAAEQTTGPEKAAAGETKAMTLRLPAEQAKALEKVAQVDEMPVSQAAREAIDKHIEQRKADPEFRARIKRIIEEDREILDRLARSA